MAEPQLQTTILLVSADHETTEHTTVYFEPDGANHQLAPGEKIRVEAVLPVDFQIEVWHTSHSITIYAESDFGLRAWRANGVELRL